MRRFIWLLLFLPITAKAQPTLEERIEGLLVGSLIGDAAGGPDEFQTPVRSLWTRTDTLLTPEGLADLGRRFHLKPYVRRPHPEPYGQWAAAAPPGTLTDDSRFKILFFNGLQETGRPDREAFARALLHWHADTTGRYGDLPRRWLDEFAYAARWVLGERDPARARPPERLWGGLPTMAGQMPFLPVAALASGDPDSAYRLVWDLDFLDNGIARDMNAALVAGLAAALAPGATWQTVEDAMRATDPFGFGAVPWVERRLGRWLDRAHDAVRRAEGRPLRLFEILENELHAETWWEAWVPMTVVFACAEMARYDPLATLQLILAFGHDTDSYLQVAGAFIGALYGRAVFPASMRAAVEARLQADYGDTTARWLQILEALRR